MIHTLLSLLLSFSFAGVAPIQSKEEIKFLSKTEDKLIGAFKTDSFLGIIGRVDEKNNDLTAVDLYSFGDTKKISMDEALCKELLTKIYGPLDKIKLKVNTVTIFTSHTGKTCEAKIDDPVKGTTIPERRTIVGFIKAKPYAIEFKLSKKFTPDDEANTRKFWESLH